MLTTLSNGEQIDIMPKVCVSDTPANQPDENTNVDENANADTNKDSEQTNNQVASQIEDKTDGSEAKREASAIKETSTIAPNTGFLRDVNGFGFVSLATGVVLAIVSYKLWKK